MNDAVHLFGIDIGGSGLKGAIVDPVVGDLVTDRYRIDTPQPSTPAAVAAAVTEIVAEFQWQGQIGIALPAVVQDGVVRTAANIDKTWIGCDAGQLFSSVTGLPVRVLNDADAAGVAEMTFGSGKGVTGLVVMLTFGTGIGSAVFYGGTLIPNSELGHLELAGMIAEHYAAARLVERNDMKLEPWARRVGEYLRHIERVLTPDLIIFGGGISKRFDEFSAQLNLDTPLEVAKLRNNAGIVGAALAGRELPEAGGTITIEGA